LPKKLAFSWVLHQHQPVGNFPWVFAQVYEICYVPLLDLLERHPRARVALHYSGPLLDWLLAERPEYVERVAMLVRRGQVEMLTGGYYEPILPILPEFDQVGQIVKMTSAVRRYFGADPAGLWLAERVWEPTLPSVLARANVKYTILDDTHFIASGIAPDDVYGYYVTEDQGMPVRLFPNPQIMRAAIPWKSVSAVERQFRQIADHAQGAPCLVMLADDGEKFGSWPDTYDRLWRRGYMERLLAMLEANSDWIEMVHPGEYMHRETPLGRVYVPSASYSEMMEWALPPERSARLHALRHELQVAGEDEILSYMQGATWRSYGAKYPEANSLHKKMLRVHRKIRDAAGLLGPYTTELALDQLWMGQCNCGYWHGVFGGLYLADIRSAIYQHLIRAESIADGALPSNDPQVTVTDFDCDGRDEVLVETAHMDVYIAPHDGGSIFEWDFKARPFNVVDTLARRPEAYHELLRHGNVHIVPPHDPMAAIDPALDPDEDEAKRDVEGASIHDIVQAKEPGLEGLLHYDTARRTALRERFFAASTTLAEMRDLTYTELGDFAAAGFEHRVGGIATDALVMDLWRDGTVRQGARAIPLRLRKSLTFTAEGAALQVSYTLHNTGTERLRARFGIEGNWGMLGGGGNPGAWYVINGDKPAEDFALDASGCATRVREVRLVNCGAGAAVTLTPGTSANLWRYPIETVSNSEAGFERSYQCSCTLLHWPIDLAAGDRWSVTLRMAIDTIE
jgi:4-alpha-glucanotransferase